MLKGVLLLAEKLKPVKITWKEDEQWLCDYTWEHSSPSAWYKDLAKAEYKRTHGEETPKESSGNMFNFLE